MYVCICRQITDNQIREICQRGAASLTDIRAQVGVGADCGRCGKLAQSIVQEFTKTVEAMSPTG